MGGFSTRSEVFVVRPEFSVGLRRNLDLGHIIEGKGSIKLVFLNQRVFVENDLF